MADKPYTADDVELVADWFRRWRGASTIRKRDREHATEILDALAAAGRLAEAELNDIEATGECCCNGCIGMGPCDLDPPRALGGDFEDDPDAGWDDDDQPPPADVILPEPESIQPLEAYL